MPDVCPGARGGKSHDTARKHARALLARAFGYRGKSGVRTKRERRPEPVRGVVEWWVSRVLMASAHTTGDGTASSNKKKPSRFSHYGWAWGVGVLAFLLGPLKIDAIKQAFP